MSDPQPAEAVKLIASLFSGDRRLLGDAVQTLSERYGRADFISAPAPFDYTDYYVKEFGGSLIRRFVAFERLIRPSPCRRSNSGRMLWRAGYRQRDKEG